MKIAGIIAALVLLSSGTAGVAQDSQAVVAGAESVYARTLNTRFPLNEDYQKEWGFFFEDKDTDSQYFINFTSSSILDVGGLDSVIIRQYDYSSKLVFQSGWLIDQKKHTYKIVYPSVWNMASKGTIADGGDRYKTSILPIKSGSVADAYLKSKYALKHNK